MKHKNTLGMVLLIILTMFQTQRVNGQKNRNAYFSEFGASFFTDFFASPAIPVSNLYSFDKDANGQPIYVKSEGHVKYATFGVVSFNYTPRFNLIEFSDSKSLSIESPITLAIGFGFKEGYLTSLDSVKNFYPGSAFGTATGNSVSMFNLSAPVFISFNTGLGSTYESLAERGLSVGLGVDISRPLFWVDGGDSFDDFGDTKKSNFYFLPAINIGYRYWRNDKASDLNLKIGYMPSTEKITNPEYDHSAFKNAFSLRLSFNKILNF
jgi:hypothetical protein